MSKNDFWTFLIIFRHEIFFGPKKNVSILFGGFHHIAWFFYGLNLRDLHQAFGIWCEIGISLRLTHLDWPRSKKTEKIRKPRSQQFFLVLRVSNLQNNCKLPSDQVWQHSVHKNLVYGNFPSFHCHRWKWIFFLKWPFAAQFWAKQTPWMGSLYQIINF